MAPWFEPQPQPPQKQPPTDRPQSAYAEESGPQVDISGASIRMRPDGPTLGSPEFKQQFQPGGMMGGLEQRDVSPVDERLEAMSAQISAMDEMIGVLRNRLAPVLKPQMNMGAVNADMQEDGPMLRIREHSPLLDRLNGQYHAADEVILQIRSLMHRLEI